MKSLREALVHKHMDSPIKDNPNSDIDWPKLNRILSSVSTHRKLANKIGVSQDAVAAVCSMIMERCPDVDMSKSELRGFLSDNDVADDWGDEEELDPYRNELNLDGDSKKFTDLCNAIADLI